MLKCQVLHQSPEPLLRRSEQITMVVMLPLPMPSQSSSESFVERVTIPHTVLRSGKLTTTEQAFSTELPLHYKKLSLQALVLRRLHSYFFNTSHLSFFHLQLIFLFHRQQVTSLGFPSALFSLIIFPLLWRWQNSPFPPQMMSLICFIHIWGLELNDFKVLPT